MLDDVTADQRQSFPFMSIKAVNLDAEDVEIYFLTVSN